jgi:surface polysaccharide O-acyltransferase-like enzyme
LPALLFSLLYLVCFEDYHTSPYKILHNLLNGYGHLWFLPMIFWCFVGCGLLNKITPPDKSLHKRVILAITALLVLFSPRIPYFGLEFVFRYFFYFYFGYLLKQGHIKIRHLGIGKIILCFGIYLFSCIGYEYLDHIGYWSALGRIPQVLVSRFTELFEATLMIVTIYNLSNLRRIKYYIESHPLMITLSGYCYGVYIYQQFILKYLYYHSSFPMHTTPAIMPWLATFITIVLSLICCHYSLKTKFGRFLIG